MKQFELGPWQVSGYYPYVPQLGMTDPRLGRNITEWIPAQVPGSVHNDLWRAGWIEDPYFGFNSLKCEWVENKWWAYRTEFDVVRTQGQRYRLRMDGLDYKCHIYLNDTFLKLHEGSFTPECLDVTELLKDSGNRLLIVFESAPDEESQAGHTTHTGTQKSRFSYKWDFSTRMVPVGIWDRIWLEEVGQAWIDNVWLIPERKKDGTGKLTLRAECSLADVDDCPSVSMKMTVRDGSRVLTEKGEAFTVKNGPVNINMELKIDNVKPWRPNGMGEQPLYQVDLELSTVQGVSHKWHGRTGFCDLKWVRNDTAPQDSLPYCLQVEGRRVYLKGVNLTPFDMLIGSVTQERYRSYLQQIRAANINLVRVNGVGLIEKEIFYDLCDEYGIFVWQEFIQTSSSMDRIPPENPYYLRLLEETSKAAILKKRNHVCLACYCGGNELTDAPGKAATYQNENIKFLQHLVQTYDTGRMMFPSSASGPKEFLELGGQGKSHDVHGPWNYGGAEEHYRLFNDSDSFLHGELGAEGMACADSMACFLPPEHMKVASMQEDLVWRHHGDWWDTYKRDAKMFGTTENLDTFIRGSQMIQAEAIRYALESNRRRKYRNSGSMMWAFDEPFPNVSNTCLVDYYGVPKMAYYALRDAYSPFHVSLRYDKLFFEPGETFSAGVYLNNSIDACKAEWSARMLGLDGRELCNWSGSVQMAENAVQKLGELRFTIPDDFPEIFLVRVECCQASVENGQRDVNEYLFSTRRDTPFRALYGKEAPLLQWEELHMDAAGEELLYRVTNRGKFVALYLFPYLKGQSGFLFSDQAYRCLLPDESRICRVTSWQSGKDWSRLQFKALF